MGDDPRLVDSTGALELRQIPKRMLVIGGDIIGLEMACVYDALGSKVSVVEFADGLIPAADRDIVKPLQKRIEKRYEAIMLKTKVTKLEARANGLLASFEGDNAPAEPQLYDMVLLAVGRRPNGKDIAADKAGVIVSERGFIPVDRQQRTNVPNIFAIGDICGDPMLAHKATNEAKVAAEVIAGHKGLGVLTTCLSRQKIRQLAFTKIGPQMRAELVFRCTKSLLSDELLDCHGDIAMWLSWER